MISKANQVTIFVRNQDEAKKFYTEKLGFEICAEEKFSPEWSYLTVSPQMNNETVLELLEAKTPEQRKLIGKQAADQVLIMFTTDDIQKDFLEMKARGVTFHGESTSVPGGKGVGFVDLYGNQFDLYQAD